MAKLFVPTPVRHDARNMAAIYAVAMPFHRGAARVGMPLLWDEVVPVVVQLDGLARL